MEPISLIITALISGATAAAKDTAGKAVKDGYEALKRLIKHKLEDDNLGQVLIDAKPEEIKQSETLLKGKISNASIDKDEEILKIAKEIMKEEDPEGASSGKYDLRGAKGVQIGNQNEQNNTFN